jgi:hypothetical protein
VKIQSLVLATLFLISSFLLTSCKKINEATNLGSDLIPPVDNINTFDTTLSVEAVNLLFPESQDTTTSGVLEYLGLINNDPLFGRSEGRLYFDLMPATNFRKPFPFVKDSLISLDSVVLILGYNSTFGDSTKPQQVQVFEIPAAQSFSYSDDYKINKNPITVLGSSISPVKTFIPSTLNDSVVARDERTANQLRIPLNTTFGQRLLNQDSTGAYFSRSTFKNFFNGFAVVPQNNGTANALIGFDLTKTKLAFYVRSKNSGKIDTSTVNFTLSDSTAIANYIKRDYAGAEIAAAVAGTTPDNLIYIQSAPGSYARISIPGLFGLNNRVVHLAELSMEQVADPLSNIFQPPFYLYLDALDGIKKRYRTIPFDVSLTSSTDPSNDTVSYSFANAEQFGMIGKRERAASGDSVYKWRFNLTRYVQRVANGTEPAQELRLYSPFPIIRALSSGVEQYISSGVPYAAGRVRLGGGNHPTQKMRMRLVYSKL